jgi:hypothetical protein
MSTGCSRGVSGLFLVNFVLPSLGCSQSDPSREKGTRQKEKGDESKTGLCPSALTDCCTNPTLLSLLLWGPGKGALSANQDFFAHNS